jgi:4'-phosphopantetheinyl transferase
VEPSLRWLSQGVTDVPGDDAWLAPREAAYLARMRFPKRRSEFRLGRWTAKRAIALHLGRGRSSAELRAILIDRAPDGAPAALVEERPAELYLTMTDRADQAVCLVGPPGTALGCDLELVEPRSDGFVGDYLTAREQRLVADAGDGRDLLANLIWCGKESALKVLRTGLRRSTLSVEVSFPTTSSVDGWAPISVRAIEGAVFPGWWQRFGRFVLTVAATADFAPPRPFVEPPGLASAVPGQQWLTG